MSLPGSVFTSSAIINSLPQVPVPLTSSASGPGSGSYQLTVSLPTVPVASMQNQTQQIQVRPRLSMSSNHQSVPIVRCLSLSPIWSRHYSSLCHQHRFPSYRRLVI